MFDNHLVTVWSVPNYCYLCGNVASILAFDSTDSKDAKLFTAVQDSECYSSENYHHLLHVIIICNYSCKVILSIIVVIVI